MPEKVALKARTTFGPITATAVLQVRPASGVIPETSPEPNWLEIWNPARWSKDDLSRISVFAMFLAQLIFWFKDRSS